MEYECGPERNAESIAKILVEWLDPLLQDYKIETICDLGCGDLFWACRLKFDGKYFGYDEVIREVAKNRAKHKGWSIKKADIFTEDIEDCDLVIVKDVFIHYSDEMCLRLLTKIKNYAKYLLAESDYGHLWPRPTRHQTVDRDRRYYCQGSLTDLTKVIGEPLEVVDIIPKKKRMAIWDLSKAQL